MFNSLKKLGYEFKHAFRITMMELGIGVKAIIHIAKDFIVINNVEEMRERAGWNVEFEGDFEDNNNYEIQPLMINQEKFERFFN